MLTKFCARITAFYSARRLRALYKSDHAMAAQERELQEQLKAVRSRIEMTQKAGPTADALLSDMRWKLHLIEQRAQKKLESVQTLRLALLQAMRVTMVELKIAQIELGII